MATIYTLEDIRIAVTELLKGGGIVQGAIGEPALDEAINRAMKRVLCEVAMPEHAGELFVSEEIEVANNQAEIPSDCMIPIALEIIGKKTIFKPFTEYIRVENDPIMGLTEYCYWFQGNVNVFIKPQPNTDDVCVLYYITLPNAMENAEDPLPTSPMLFQPIVYLSAAGLAAKIDGFDPNLTDKYYTRYNESVGFITGKTNLSKLESFLAELAKVVSLYQSNNGS